MSLSDTPSLRDLRALSLEELEFLAADLRHEIVQTCLKNGGHLGASLGAVELAIALHRVFESPREPLIWDVGHQAYAHKLLTGRRGRFGTLRTFGGISGFLSRDESEHDVFGAGHSSTSLSAALAFAWSRAQNDREAWTVAVIGDGGLTAGLALEALNHLRSLQLSRLLVVLNDNQMSIARNVGAVPGILGEGRGPEFFALLGMDYVGPVDGHDLAALIGTFQGLRSSTPDRPVVVHALTQKGKGYLPAEARPAAYHGVSPLQAKVPASGTAATRTYSDAFGEALCKIAEQDPRVVAITAAMPDGTGLSEFERRFPDRFFDVGIAEPHAVTFAAGLAAAGWKPVVAVYSTFLQRGLDSILHDVALQGLSVVFAVDRAGWVGADGPTHHGAFDLAYLGLVPGMTVEAPACLNDVERQLREALQAAGPVALRYPRGGGAAELSPEPQENVRIHREDSNASLLLIGLGHSADLTEKLEGELLRRNANLALGRATVTRAKPIPARLVQWIRRHAEARVAVVEAGTEAGGFGAALRSALGEQGGRVVSFAYPDRFAPQGSVDELARATGLNVASIAQRLMSGRAGE